MQFPALSLGSVWPDVLPTSTLASVAWTNSLGHALIKAVTIEVGGQKIDSQYGEWLEIWNALTQVAEKENGYNHMIRNVLTDLKSSLPSFCRNKTWKNSKNSAIMINV